MAQSVEEFLEHAGVKGMKWGVRKAEDSGGASKKAPSAGKQKDMDIKAARKRLNEGKNVAQKLWNMQSFGKPLGGRQLLELSNKGKSPDDIAMAARMTRGEKTATAVLLGASVVLNVASRR